MQIASIDVKETYSVCGLTPKRNKSVAGECSVRAGERAIFIWDVGNLQGLSLFVHPKLGHRSLWQTNMQEFSVG